MSLLVSTLYHLDIFTLNLPAPIRRFPLTKRLGIPQAFAAQLEEEDAKALTQISSNMSSIYGRGTVCLGPQEGEQVRAAASGFGES